MAKYIVNVEEKEGAKALNEILSQYDWIKIKPIDDERYARSMDNLTNAVDDLYHILTSSNGEMRNKFFNSILSDLACKVDNIAELTSMLTTIIRHDINH